MPLRPGFGLRRGRLLRPRRRRRRGRGGRGRDDQFRRASHARRRGGSPLVRVRDRRRDRGGEEGSVHRRREHGARRARRVFYGGQQVPGAEIRGAGRERSGGVPQVLGSERDRLHARAVHHGDAHRQGAEGIHPVARERVELRLQREEVTRGAATRSVGARGVKRKRMDAVFMPSQKTSSSLLAETFVRFVSPSADRPRLSLRSRDAARAEDAVTPLRRVPALLTRDDVRHHAALHPPRSLRAELVVGELRHLVLHSRVRHLGLPQVTRLDPVEERVAVRRREVGFDLPGRPSLPLIRGGALLRGRVLRPVPAKVVDILRVVLHDAHDATMPRRRRRAHDLPQRVQRLVLKLRARHPEHPAAAAAAAALTLALAHPQPDLVLRRPLRDASLLYALRALLQPHLVRLRGRPLALVHVRRLHLPAPHPRSELPKFDPRAGHRQVLRRDVKLPHHDRQRGPDPGRVSDHLVLPRVLLRERRVRIRGHPVMRVVRVDFVVAAVNALLALLLGVAQTAAVHARREGARVAPVPHHERDLPSVLHDVQNLAVQICELALLAESHDGTREPAVVHRHHRRVISPELAAPRQEPGVFTLLHRVIIAAARVRLVRRVLVPGAVEEEVLAPRDAPRGGAAGHRAALGDELRPSFPLTHLQAV
eukprot:31323-Pelagococcus_subviridis.AAC.8